MKVTNMTSSKGNRIANQFIIYDSDGSRYFQSYNSVIAKIDNANNITLDQKFWNYSVTTGKYRNIFLEENKQQTEEKIKSGAYQLADLNKPEAQYEY
tara:strand:- start:690 stop:980 length:291 start_codon:yes stop_codon:yes gene_type:complete